MLTTLRRRYSLTVSHALIGSRADDRFFVAYPRSGSTWLRTILVNILMPQANSEPEVFNRVFPGVSGTNVFRIRRSSSPRVVFSHTAYRGDLAKVLYLVRDGRDVLVSFYHYLVTRGGTEGSLSFEEWFERYCSGQYGHRWDQNVSSWLTAGEETYGSRLKIMRFEDLKRAPREQVTIAARHLDIETPPERVVAAIESANLDRLRAIERERGVQGASRNSSFYRGGAQGQWQEYFTPALTGRFEAFSRKAMEMAGYV